MSTELICSTWSVWFSMNISTISGKVCCPYVNAIFYMERNDQHWRFSEWQLRHQHAEIVLNKLRFHRCQRLDFWIYLLMSTLQMVQLIRWILAWEHPFSAIVRTCCQFLGQIPRKKMLIFLVSILHVPDIFCGFVLSSYYEVEVPGVGFASRIDLKLCFTVCSQ
uniref:Uncharacterized protein n=1 Tax=Oryza punctata TaxID=4537 RepID=A0A0E0JX69_ORYPU